MSHINVTPKKSVVDEIAQIEETVARRAYQLFEQRGAVPGDPCADWFAAEREVLRRPEIEVREDFGAYLVTAPVPGVDPEHVYVEVAPQDLVIRGEAEQTSLFNAVHLPSAIDVAKVQADVRNGMLTVKAPFARPRPREAHVA